MRKIAIYALRCPTDGDIRYIGKTTNPKRRLRDHLRELRRRTPLYEWIALLRADGAVPTMDVMEWCDESEWKERETTLIALHRSSPRLLNVADGGDEPKCPLHVRQENGRKVSRAIHGDPQRRKDWEEKQSAAINTDPIQKRLWELKRAVGQALHTGHCSNRTRAKMRAAAQLRPDLLGHWANIPDRLEEAA